MDIREYGKKIAEELSSTLSRLDWDETEALAAAVIKAKKTYVAGAGRSLLMIRALAMRLMQTGFTAYVVGRNRDARNRTEDL
jgi:6-phospho-3-hexuloisomerase